MSSSALVIRGEHRIRNLPSSCNLKIGVLSLLMQHRLATGVLVQYPH